MIFVTVGNASQGFRRLLDAVDRLACDGALGDEEVLIQAGSNCGVVSTRSRVRPVLPLHEFQQALETASLVVAHGGAGTLIQVLSLGKVPVVMPRRLHYGEVVDDHQVELVRMLAEEGRVVPAYEPADLAAAISEARQRHRRDRDRTEPPLLRVVARLIDELLQRKRGLAT